MNVGILEAWLKLRDDLTPALKAIGPSLEKAEQNINKAAQALLPMSAGLALVGGASLKFASDFNSAMTESLAILPQMSEAMRKDLGDTARQVALTTTQSAEDAAKGYYYLASAGIDTAEALKNALPLAAQFAQAGVMNMADATEILVDSVKSLGLSVDRDMNRVGDVIVKAAVASSASVQQLGDALTNKAAIAMRTFGISVEQGTAVLSVFADQGVKGQIAGERLSILINGLAEAYGKNSKAFKDFGINLYDSAGRMRNVADVASDFEKALSGLSDQQKTATLEQMNLTRETKAAVLQLVGASSEIKRYEQAYKSAGGTMKEIADNQMKSFANQLSLTKKAVIDAAISIGDALRPAVTSLLPLVRDLASFVKTAADSFVQLSAPTKTLIIGFLAFLTALGPVLLAVGSLIGAWTALTPLMAAAGVTIGAVATFAGVTSAALGALALVVVGIIAYWEDMTDAVNVFMHTGLGEWVSNSITGTFEVLGGVFTVVAAVLQTLSFGFIDLQTTVKNSSTFFDALNLSWLALKFTAIQLGVAVLTAQKALMFDGDPMKAEVQKDIDALKNLQLSYSDSAAKIVSGVAQTSEALKSNSGEVKKNSDEFSKLTKASANTASTHVLTAKETKALDKAMADASKAAHELAVEQIKLKQLQEDAAMKAGMAGLDVIFRDAATEAKRLNAQTVPIKVQVMEAAIAAKRASDDTKTWNQAVMELAKSMNLPKDILDALLKKTDAVKTKSFDWGKVLEGVSNAFHILGISTDSALGKAITALTTVKSITDEAKKSMVDANGVATKDFLKLDSVKQGQVAMAGLNAAMVAFKSGALGGAAAGAQFGSMFGPVGTAIGGALGGLLGWIGGSSKAKQEAAKLTAEIDKQRQAYIKNAGGLATLQSKAREVGATLDGIFNAKTLQAYNTAVDELNKKFDDFNTANQELEAAMEKYGITIDQLGPKFAQQQLDKQAAQLLKEYMLLNAAGVDHSVIISKMGPELQKYVNQSLAAGTAIPENMRPILEEMLKLGLLTDEAGNKLENLDGLTFTESLTEGLTRAIDAIYDLITALTGVPRNVNTTITQTYRTEGNPNQGGGRGEEIAMASGFNGFVNGPTRILVGEAGREHLEVVPDDEWKDRQKSGGKASASGDTYIIFDTTKGTPYLTSAAEARRMTAMLGSGAVKVNSRVLTRRAG